MHKHIYNRAGIMALLVHSIIRYNTGALFSNKLFIKREIYLKHFSKKISLPKLAFIVTAVILSASVLLTLKSSVLMHGMLKEERESFRLGTIVRLTVYGRDKERLERAVNASMTEITRFEDLLSVNIASSDISKINSASGVNAVPVTRETGEVLLSAVKWADTSKGLFDPTIGPVVKLWAIGTSAAHVPGNAAIKDARDRVDYRHIKITGSSSGGYNVLIGKGQSVDLGGIAKGWIADRIAGVIRKHGVKSAIIDLGGNIVVIGKSPRGKPWWLGLQYPFKPRGEYFAVIEAEDISVVTSGPYERFFESGGIRYHHIFDPATGYPAKSDLSSVSVIGKSSADADALCTTLFVMGFKRSAEYLREHRDIKAVMIVTAGGKSRVVITPGLDGSFSLKDGQLPLEVLK